MQGLKLVVEGAHGGSIGRVLTRWEVVLVKMVISGQSRAMGWL